MSKVVLVRHGRTAWHAEGRYAGTADVPLDDYGLEQVELVVERLNEVQIDRVYSSPLSRCSAMAEKVASVHGLEVAVDGRLREIDLGRWDGELYGDIIKNDGEILKKWTKNPVSVTIPGGESLTDVQERAMQWLSDISSTFPDATILASSHGGPIRAMIASVLGLPLERIFRLTVDLASVSIINYMGKFSNLELLNERRHLGEKT